MGKKRLAKYLASKPEGEYSHLDKILKAYADSEAAQLLSKYEFYDTQITFQIVKNDNNLQIDGKFYNLAINISFLERGYEYAIYPLDKRIKQIEDRFESRVGDRSDPQKQTKIVCAFIRIVHFIALGCFRLFGGIRIYHRHKGVWELVDHNSFCYFFISR